MATVKPVPAVRPAERDPAEDQRPSSTSGRGLTPLTRELLVNLLLVGAGLLVMYLPTFWSVYRLVWRLDDQGHGPVILAVALWLIWRKRGELAAAGGAGAAVPGFSMLAVALLTYILGRSQGVIQLEVISFILLLIALHLLWGGGAALKLSAFALFFLIFMIPLPGVFVQAITVPLKSAVSFVAENILFDLGYPISRSGVVLNIGQYQLLVADACSGLNSMFTLESLGLLYMNVMEYASVRRNLLLATLIIPISFTANVVRVMILVLITYYYGDEAGQGFVHEFAGLLLFSVAFALMMFVDKLIGLYLSRSGARRTETLG